MARRIQSPTTTANILHVRSNVPGGGPGKRTSMVASEATNATVYCDGVY